MCKYDKKLLALLSIKSTSRYLKDSILAHPEHPSLLSISDTLKKYQIETLAIKIDANKLNQIPLPCIVQVEINGTPLFFVIKNVIGNTITYYDDKNKEIITLNEKFLKIWSGICLLVETTQQSKENGIEKKNSNKTKTKCFKNQHSYFIDKLDFFKFFYN